MSLCAGCEAPTNDGIHHCTTCTEQLEYTLAETDTILDDLTTTITRQDRHGTRVGGTGTKTAPLPYNVAAAEARDALHETLLDAALKVRRMSADEFDGIAPEALAGYLMRNIGVLILQAWVGDFHTRLRAAQTVARKTTDALEARVFAGTCQECDTDLYAAKGDTLARCRTCGTEYDVQAWRTGAKAYAVEAARDLIGYPDSVAARVTQFTGMKLEGNTVRTWASRGVLVRANPSHDGVRPLRPMYRLGDVLDCWEQRRERKAG